MVRFVALGSPLELWENDRQIELGPAKLRGVLSVLLYARGDPVHTDRLIERVWGEEPPGKPLESLQSYLSRLRTVLCAGTERPGAQLRRPAAGLYQLLVDDDESVDLRCFQRLSKDAHHAAARGERDVAIGLLNAAESLWRGEPFTELPSEWAASVRARLEEDRRYVREQRIRLELELGRHADLIGELRELVAEYPLNQRQAGALMTALDQCGRTDEALGVYRKLRRRLCDSQGIEPGPELQGLHVRLLEGTPPRARAGHTPADRASQTAPSEAPEDQEPAERPGPSAALEETPEAAPNSLPRDVRDFIGRERELAALLTAPRGEHAGALPLTVIHGMAGVGKTALAVRAARRLAGDYPGGAFHVDLRGYSEGQQPSDPAEVLGILLRTAGAWDAAAEGAGAASLESRSCRWREWTARHRALLVLDNVRDAAQVRPVLPGSARCRVLVTSRSRLTALEGAEPLFLDVLSTGEAAALFTRVVGDARVPGPAELRRVVGVFGGHPLAVQLLAGSFRSRESWDLGYLAERVEGAADPLDELDGETVRSAFRLSYQALDAPARRLFRRLSLHAGPDLDLGAARALAGPERGAQGPRAHEGGGPADHGLGRTLATLLDHHLLEEPVRDRFALHDLARAFARQVCREEESGQERQAALDRLLAYHLTAADRADRLLRPHRRRLPVPDAHRSPCAPEFADADQATVWLSVERPNLLALARSAAALAPAYAVLLPHVLAPSLKLWGAWETAAELHGAAATRARASGDPRGLAQALTERADVLAQESHGEALRCASEAHDLFQEVRDESGRAYACFQLGRAHYAAGRVPDALRVLGEALALSQADGDRGLEAGVLNVRGVALYKAGLQEEAREQFREMLRLHRSTGDLHGQLQAINNLGELFRYAGYYEQARAHYERSLELAESVGGRQERANLYNNLGAVCHACGETGQALAYLRRALASYRASHDPRGESDTLNTLGEVFAANAQYGKALWHYIRAEKVAGRISAPYERQTALIGIGTAHRALGTYGASRVALQEALVSARSVEAPAETAAALDGLARTLLISEGASSATPFAEDALRLYERLGLAEEARALRRLMAARESTGA